MSVGGRDALAAATTQLGKSRIGRRRCEVYEINVEMFLVGRTRNMSAIGRFRSRRSGERPKPRPQHEAGVEQTFNDRHDASRIRD